MNRYRKNVPIIEIPIFKFTYNGIIKLPDPSIVRIAVIEIPIIEDLL